MAWERVELVPGGEPRSSGSDQVLAAMLASMAGTDGTLHPDELAFLRKLRPDLRDEAEVAEWVRGNAGPLDLQGVAASLRSPEDRWKALRFAARMAWKDGSLADPERALLGRLAQALGLPELAVEWVLREMEPNVGRFSSERILRVLLDARWDSVQFASGPLVSADLISVWPPGSELVARVGLDRVEVMALSTDGLCGRFLGGAAWIAWSELVTYSRGRDIGEALVLHTEDDRRFALVDQRLAGFATILDHLLDQQGRARGAAPVVTQRS
jgi:hypothetical protein